MGFVHIFLEQQQMNEIMEVIVFNKPATRTQGIAETLAIAG